MTHDAFAKDLEALLNRHSMEHASNTPDFLLARYLLSCLKAWNETSTAREHWYGMPLSLGGKDA